MNQIGGGNCTLCNSVGTNRSTCPLNPTATNKNYKKHPLAKTAQTNTVPAALIKSAQTNATSVVSASQAQAAERKRQQAAEINRIARQKSQAVELKRQQAAQAADAIRISRQAVERQAAQAAQAAERKHQLLIKLIEKKRQQRMRQAEPVAVTQAEINRRVAQAAQASERYHRQASERSHRREAERERQWAAQASERYHRQVAERNQKANKMADLTIKAVEPIHQQVVDKPSLPTVQKNVQVSVLSPVDILKRIDDMRDMKGIFNSLLFTHNTSISTFLKMLNGEYTNIRCCINDNTPIGRGAQFRYGLDSQYGEVKLIMKPDFQLKYNRGVSLDSRFTPKANHADFFHRKEYFNLDGPLQYILNTQALNYNFRHLDVNNGLVNSGGVSCAKADIMSNYEKGLPPQILNPPVATWCNIQLQLGENVSFDDILAVIVPGFLKNLPKYASLINKSNSNPGPFQNKIVYSKNSEIKNYYSLLDLNLIKDYDFYEDPSVNPQLPKNLDYSDTIMSRSIMPYGNSSAISVSEDIFMNETQIYMKYLVSSGIAVSPMPEAAANLHVKILKPKLLIDDTLQYIDYVTSVIAANNYLLQENYSWLFFRRGNVILPFSKPTNQWKVFYNPKKEYLLPVLELILETLKDQPNVSGKILTDPYATRNDKAAIEDSTSPKIVMYYIGSTDDEAKRLLKQQTTMILSQIPSDQLDNISMACTRVVIDGDNVEQCGPSFSKKLNPLVYYTQGGYSESSRQHLVLSAMKNKLHAGDKLKLEYDGENYYKYLGTTDPFTGRI